MIKGLGGGAKLPQAPSPETTPMSYDQFGFVLLKLALLGFVFSIPSQGIALEGRLRILK